MADKSMPSLILALGKAKPPWKGGGPKAKPGAPSEEPEADDTEGTDDLEMAAADLKTAIAGGDDAAIADAFRAMHDICSSY